MTTIAWDGHMLAADKQCSLFKGEVTKIHQLKDGRLFGSSGDLRDIFSVKAWLNDGGEKPKVSDRFHGIVIDKGRLLVMEDNLAFIPYEDQKFFAIGSGREYAMAAMFLGRSAHDAVCIAHEFDSGTGLEITVLTQEKPRLYPGDPAYLPPTFPSEASLSDTGSAANA